MGRPFHHPFRTVRLLLLFVAGAGAHAQPSHLVPEVGPLTERDEYEALLGEVFNSDHHDSAIVARMVYLHSFGREWLVGVRRSGDGYEAFSVVPDSSLYYTGWVRQADSSVWMPEAALRVGLARESAPLDSATAELIGAVWERAILATRYPASDDVVIQYDGVGAHFSRWVLGRGMIAGQTHSPPAGSGADALMELGLMVGRFAVGDGVTEPALHEAAARVAALLEASE